MRSYPLLKIPTIADPVSQFILPLDNLPLGGKPTPLGGGKLSRDILSPALIIFTPWGGKLSRPVYLAPPPPAYTGKILLCDVYYYLQHFNN